MEKGNNSVKKLELIAGSTNVSWFSEITDVLEMVDDFFDEELTLFVRERFECWVKGIIHAKSKNSQKLFSITIIPNIPEGAVVLSHNTETGILESLVINDLGQVKYGAFVRHAISETFDSDFS